MTLTRRKFLQSFFIVSTMATTKGWATNGRKPVAERQYLYPQGVASRDRAINHSLITN